MQSRFESAKVFRAGRLAAAGFAVAALGACGSEPAGPGPTAPTIATVEVSAVADPVVVGGTVQMVAVARTASGTAVQSATFTWSSENATVASVSATGLLLAKSDGSARITATSGTRSGQTTVQVRAPLAAPTIVGLSPASAAAGGPDLLLTVTGTGFRPDIRLQWNGTARPTNYVSETVARATIWANDLAAIGTAVVEVVNAASEGGPSAPASFQIVPQAVPVASVELNRAVAYTVTGAAVPMTATPQDDEGNPLTGRLITWTSSNHLVATVTGAGLVQPMGVGEVTITATSEGRNATLALTVGTRPTHLLLDDGVSGLSSLDMRLGSVPVTFWQSALGSRSSDPSVSPDGRFIAYTIELGATRSIAVVDQAARTYLFLTNDAWSDQAAWSPAGGRIAFRSHRAGRGDVWVMNDDGTGAVNLTAAMPAGWESGWPAWSPDGTRLVFSSGATPASLSLYLVKPDGTGLQTLFFSADQDTETTWNGDAIVFTRRAPDGTTNLFRRSIGGGPLIQLTNTGQASMPAWSPDGRWIAFADGASTNGRFDIMAVRPFGEEVRPLSLLSSGGGGRNPTWLTHP